MAPKFTPIIGIRDGDDLASAMIDDSLRRVTKRVASGPIHGIPPRRVAHDRVTKGNVPHARPSAYDESVVIEDPVEECRELRAVLGEFEIGIEDSRVLVVAVQFDEIALGVRERLGATQGMRRVDHRRLNSVLSKRLFQQAVEVGGDEHANHPTLNEIRNRMMCPRGSLATLLQVFLGRLDVAGQNGSALVAGSAELSNQLGVVRCFPEFVFVPGGAVQLTHFALGNRHSTD